MNPRSNIILSVSFSTQPARKLRRTISLVLRQRHLYGRPWRYITGKELDTETGLYYYGARYLDPKISRWLSGDPAVGEYIPSAPASDEARKRNGNLPGMGGVFNYANLHVYHYGGNNPVVYRDPDGSAIIAAAPIIGGTGVIIGIIAVATVLTILATITFHNIGILAQEALSRSRAKTEERHSFPVFLGGNANQNLVPMERNRHINLHKDLRVFLRDNYPGMEPKPGNPGVLIQEKYSVEQRKEAMARFYLTHVDVYADAAYQFFTDNPETFNDINIEWSKENAAVRIKEYPLRLITTPTEE